MGISEVPPAELGEGKDSLYFTSFAVVELQRKTIGGGGGNGELERKSNNVKTIWTDWKNKVFICLLKEH